MKREEEALMNLHHLFVFYRVARTQHITRAAEELFMSQPAVSQHIRALEKELKQALLVRMGNKIYCTEAGTMLAEYAARIFALVGDAEQAMREFHGLQRGSLRIGASTTPGTYLLPGLLGRYQGQYPHINLTVTMKNTATIFSLVRQYLLDIGIVAGEENIPDVEQRKWQVDRVVFIGPATSSLPVPCSLEQLQHLPQPLLLREKGSGTRAVVEQYFHGEGFALPKTCIELNSAEMMKRAVMAGLGYTFISQSALDEELLAKKIRVIPLANGVLHRSLFIIFPKGRQMSRATQAFLDMLEEEG
jgi:DNA-binding transcriptional LysR family regulator